MELINCWIHGCGTRGHRLDRGHIVDSQIHKLIEFDWLIYNELKSTDICPNVALLQSSVEKCGKGRLYGSMCALGWSSNQLRKYLSASDCSIPFLPTRPLGSEYQNSSQTKLRRDLFFSIIKAIHDLKIDQWDLLGVHSVQCWASTRDCFSMDWVILQLCTGRPEFRFFQLDRQIISERWKN